MVDYTRRRLLSTSLAAAIGASTAGIASAEDSDTKHAPTVKGSIKRFATTSLGAEVTGPYVTVGGDLFFSHQHPSRDNPAPYDKSGIGYISGYQFQFDGDSDFQPLGAPTTKEAQSHIRVADGEYMFLAHEGDTIGDGETLGVPTTPEGEDLIKFAGSRYAEFGYTPDMNELVATDDEEADGYLFTNFESSPGNITRMPVSREDGTWEADLEATENLANSEKFRQIGGTRINCWGDTTPWGTPLSAEEEYGHTRLSGGHTAGDIVEAESGVGRRGGAAFWNRPNPTESQSAVNEIFGDRAWYLQGYWALGGVELLAYYLGADPVDQNDDTNTTDPIGDVYPNRYRYGHLVEIRNPTSDDWAPVKHHAFGRVAAEVGNVMPDEKTVYITSDGTNKGFYKFIADRPIPSYDDPMDIRGTLSVAKVTNDVSGSPAEADLELTWLELGSASNAEVESWIAEYDGITQVDYLETHAETDWREDLDAALREADKGVAKHGNQDYITDEEIVEWAEQYERHGPDSVDENLRKVPFLETRAAAKEIGATVEFRKAEGIDHVDDARPGDYVYLGLAELNSGMADGQGDIQLERVDGGIVYRAEIEPDYNLAKLEPVVVGSDATDTTAVANDRPLNVDNVLALPDGRVLLCEDADKLGRSYPNDCLWVYDPEDTDADRGHGNEEDRDDEDNPARDDEAAE